jgi:hypothetical protein
MRPTAPPNYLAGYPAHLVDPVRQAIAAGRLGEILMKKYPQAHDVRTDKALYDYVLAIKAAHLRNAPQPSKVAFDGKCTLTVLPLTLPADSLRTASPAISRATAT